MAIITLFEMATQHGEITAHMGRYLQKQRHTYDIVRKDKSPDSPRIYRVFKSVRPEVPIMLYEIPERTSVETAGMWAHKVKRELDQCWKEAEARMKAERLATSTTPTSPATAPPAPTDQVGSGPAGLLPGYPSTSLSGTSSSTPTESPKDVSTSSEAVPVPGNSAPARQVRPSKPSSKGTTKTSKTRSENTGS